MRVRLTRKYAQSIDDIDLSRWQVGDVLDLPEREARLLIAEGWASPVPEQMPPLVPPPSRAGDIRRRPQPRRNS